LSDADRRVIVDKVAAIARRPGLEGYKS
jgi:hypothetical protein